MSRNVIQDGYTRDGYIAAVPRLHEELEFRYRPMWGGRPQVFASPTFRAQTPEVQAEMEAAAIVEHLVSWGEVDAKGASLPIDANHVKRLPVPMRQMLLNIIAGYVPSDIRPTEPVEITVSSAEEARRLLHAIESGKTLGELAAEEDGKN